MGFTCGIVGLPNVGKSTIFNALSKARNAESANYPFCTIDPNRGVVPVPDERMVYITSYIKPKSIVPTSVEFVDIAGLVKGAGKGEGRGNQFLSHIRQVDAIAHVVRCFEDEMITHVEGSVDPLRDTQIINTELIISDLEVAERGYSKNLKLAKNGDVKQREKVEVLKLVIDHLGEGKPIRSLLLSNPEYSDFVSEYQFLTAKPVLYVANVGEKEIEETNKYVVELKRISENEKAKLVVIAGQTECDILDLSEDEGREYLAELGIARSGLNDLIIAGYDILDLITYFTAGEKEVRAWTIKKGTNAQNAAGKIHSDIQKGFIRAEVVSYQDFFELKSLTLAKEKGKMRLEGKEYVVQDGDIIYFRHNT